MKITCYLPSTLEAIKNLTDEDLNKYWNMFYKWKPYSRKSQYRPLWYAIQCQLTKCKLADKYITRLERYSNNPDKYIQSADKNKYELAVGSIITRRYRGKDYQVTVKGPKEYEYQDKTYDNLTTIADSICGSHVSGPAFFGVKSCKK